MVEIDLNKLNTDELEIVLKVMKKQKQPHYDDSIEDNESLKNENTGPLKKCKKKYHRHEQKDKWAERLELAKEYLAKKSKPLPINKIVKRLKFPKGKSAMRVAELLEKDPEITTTKKGKKIKLYSIKSKEAPQEKTKHRSQYNKFLSKRVKELKAQGIGYMAAVTMAQKEYSELKKHDEKTPSTDYYSRQKKKNAKFLIDKIKRYERQGINSADAMKMAQNDWDRYTRPKQEKAVIIDNFPELQTIQNELNKILEDVVRNVIANHGQLAINTDGYTLGISDNRQWKEFCMEFMIKSQKICDYFNVPNKFRKFLTGGGNTQIQYR